MALPTYAGFDGRGQIDNNMTKFKLDLQLQRRFPIDDPMMKIAGSYDPNNNTVPDAVMVQVNAGNDAFTTISLREDFTGAGGVGSVTPSSLTPEVPSFKFMDLFADNVLHVTEYNAPKWGLEGVTDEVYKCMSDNEESLSRWHKEKEGIYRRQSVIEGFSGNVNATGGGTRLRINRNVVVGNSSTFAQPVTYDDTQATYITAINAAWTSGTVKKDLDLDFLYELHQLATVDMALEPVTIGGEKCYVFLVSANQVKKLMKPSASAGWTAYMKGSTAVMELFKQSFMMQYHSIVLIQDNRCARVTIGSAAFTTSYKNPGRGTDGRASAGATVADACLLLGRGAFYKYSMLNLHWGTNPDNANFGKTPKLAAIATYGYNSGEFYDAAGLWKVNDSSMVVLLGSN